MVYAWETRLWAAISEIRGCFGMGYECEKSVFLDAVVIVFRRYSVLPVILTADMTAIF
jgi:hypothetical protein